MADLQDTNAATEEIYGPLLIVDCPVADEMIFQKLWMDGSKRKAKLFLLSQRIIYLSDVLGGSHFKKCTQERACWP